MVKKKETWNISEEELKKHIDELRMELIKAGSKVATGTIPKNPLQIRQSRRTIARMLTIIKEKKKLKNKEEIKKHG